MHNLKEFTLFEPVLNLQTEFREQGHLFLRSFFPILTHFGSIERIKKASVQDLLQIKGITQSDADALQKGLNPN